MEPSRLKRQRLMMSSSYSYVSPPRLDLPATFESLNDDTLTTVLEFVGKKSYATYAGINKHCKEVYLNTPGMTKETFLFGYGPLSAFKEEAKSISEVPTSEEEAKYDFFNEVGKGVVYHNRRDVIEWALQDRKKYLLGAICNVAGEEGRIDILNEVLSNVEDWDDKEDIFYYVQCHVHNHGKLEVLKWLDIKEFDIDKSVCAKDAALSGHLHILQWLQEEQGLELHEESLYTQALYTGQLRVMKWLREQKVDWDRWTFKFVAQEGTLDILKWLHNEGYPWPDDGVNDVDDVDDRVHEDEIEPEALGWLRANGYGDRIRS